MQRISQLLKELVTLALPMMVGMAALVGLGVTDTLMAGLASTRDLAALAMGAAIFVVPMMLLIGLQSVVAPRVAWQSSGAGPSFIQRDCWQAMWMGLVVGGVCALLVSLCLPLLSLLQLEPAVESTARQYLQIVLFALPLLGISLGLRNTIDGLGYPGLNMWVSLACLVLNVVLDYLFVFGKFGFPQLGATGCALATVGVVLLQVIAPALLCLKHSAIKPYRLLNQWFAPDLPVLKSLLILGIPAAVAITLEECFFTSTSLLVAPMGTVALGTHQIIMNIAMLALIFPISFGQAAAIVIGRSLGADDAVSAAVQAKLFLVTLLGMMCVCCVAMLLSRHFLLSLFTKDSAVLMLGGGLLLIVSFQLIVDGLQIGSNIALKGYQDTLVPAVFQLISYWLVGFPLAYALTRTQLFGEPGGVESVWYALFTGLSVAACFGVWRLLVVSGEFAGGSRVLESESSEA